MIKHEFEQIRRTWRRTLGRPANPELRPATGAGQLTPRQLREEVLALLG